MKTLVVILASIVALAACSSNAMPDDSARESGSPARTEVFAGVGSPIGSPLAEASNGRS